MKKYFILLIGVFIFSSLYSQQLKWVKKMPAYVDLIDRHQNIYIGAWAYGVTDIDPGPDTVNIDVNKEGSYLVKYDSAFNIKWVKTDPSPDWGFERSILTTINDEEIVILTSKDSELPNYEDEFYLEKYNSNGSFIEKKKAFYLESGLNTYFLDISTDSDSNIWLSAIINGSIAYGINKDTLISSASYAPIIAKYNKNLDFIKIIHGKPSQYYSSFNRGSGVKLDTSGTIHQIRVDGRVNYYFTTDTSGIINQSKLFESSNADIFHLILTDDDNIIVIGTFNNAVDFDNSLKEKFLSPKGTIDVFIAKYTREGDLLDVWQIGGSGSITNANNLILKNNFMALGLISEGSSVIDFDLSADTFNVELNNQMIYACYDMSIKVSGDSIQNTELNTNLVADIFKGPGGSNPQYLLNYKDTLYFVADNGVSGNELWKSDGTAKGTSLIKDLTLDGNSFHLRQSSNDVYPVMANDNNLFVLPDTLTHALSLWQTLGDSSTFSQLSPGIAYNQFILKNKLYAIHDTSSLLVSDGTKENTIIKTFDLNISQFNFRQLVNADSVIYLPYYNGSKTELLKFNGDTFTKIATLNQAIYGLETFKGRLYFYVLSSMAHPIPIKLCSINPNGGDFQVLIDFPENTTRTDRTHFFIKSLDSLFIFLGYDTMNNLEMWSSDGTLDNTSIIRDINPNGNLNVNNLQLSEQGILFFTANDGHGNDIFQSNGTSEGTVKLRGLNPFGKVNYNSMAIVRDVLYFGATNDATGSELWKYKFINKIQALEENRSFSSDSSSFTCKIRTRLFPEDATDTSLTFELIDTAGYPAIIDSLGNCYINLKRIKSSSTLSDSITLRVLANDGSKTHTIFKFAIQEAASSINPSIREKEFFKIWPNPFKHDLNIKFEDEFTGHIIIIDNLARTLLKKSYIDVMFVNIDSKQLPKGLLYIQVNSGKDSYTYKVIHQ